MSRRIIVENVRPPIPVRDFDWCATFADYEPGEPQGYGATKQAAIDDLMSKADDSTPATPAPAEPVTGWKLVQVNESFDALMTALDRAARKGYMPDAMSDEWEAFDYDDAPATPAARDVLAERERQKTAEGWTPEHDDEHIGEELARAAGCYALGQPIRWPWTETHPLMGVMAHHGWKPKDRRSNLVRAGALILAEIERLDRAAIAAATGSQS